MVMEFDPSAVRPSGFRAIFLVLLPSYIDVAPTDEEIRAARRAAYSLAAVLDVCAQKIERKEAGGVLIKFAVRELQSYARELIEPAKEKYDDSPSSAACKHKVQDLRRVAEDLDTWREQYATGECSPTFPDYAFNFLLKLEEAAMRAGIAA